MDLRNVKVEILFFIFLFAVIFFQLQQAEMKTVVSMLLITLWGGALWYYLQYRSKQEATKKESTERVLDQENKKKQGAPEMNTSNYYVKAAPKKGLGYLKKNEALQKIAMDLVFTKTFDEQKYQDLLVYMNNFQKVYMYILAERYDCTSYVPTFLDLRENILELLYQFYLVVPKTFKHIYGVEPYTTLEKNIEDFLKLSRRMIEVLENFCRMDLKKHYFPMTQPMPFDAPREKEKRNMVI